MGLSSKQASQGDSLEYWSQLQVGDHLDVDNVPKPKPKAATNEFTRNNINQQKQQQQQQQSKGPPLNCPRCDSTNTKFCYYNNYSKLQPRHFCRACKRHWTAGGTLRNVPVGGGSRKNSRGKRSTTRTAATVRHANTADVNNEEEQQQLLSAGTMFADIFEQVMFHQPADDQMMTVNPDDQFKLNPGIEMGVGSSSSSSLSRASPNSILFGESMLNLTDVGYDHGGGCWNDAASYWNCTWDGVNDGSV